MKACIHCKIEKPLEDYYVHKQMGDGHLNKCKDCSKKYQQGRRADPEFIKDEKVRSKAYWSVPKNRERKNRDHARLMKEYSATEEGRLKAGAQKYLNNAIRDGRFERKYECEDCGTTERKIEGHHHMGYERENWLNVQWLCVNCHKKAHREMKEELV